jgi:hypothetical protein
MVFDTKKYPPRPDFVEPHPEVLSTALGIASGHVQPEPDPASITVYE